MTGHDRNTQPEPLNRLVSKLFQNKDWEIRMELHRVFLFWEEAVGTDISKQAQPHLIRQTTLWVRVKDSIWMQQLHLQKIHLLERLNQRLENTRLTDIRFKLDTELVPPKPTRAENISTHRLQPNKEIVEKGKQMTESLKSDEVRDALRSLWNALHR